MLAEKMAEAEEKLSDAEKKIKDGWAEVNDGRAELMDNEVKLKDGEKALISAQKSADEKFETAQKEIDDGHIKLNAGEAELNSQETAALEEFSSHELKLAESRNTLSGQKSEAETKLTALISMLPADAQIIWNNESTQKVWADMVNDGVKAAPYLLASKQGETLTKKQTDDYNAAMNSLNTHTEELAVSFISGGYSLTEEELAGLSSLAVNFGTLNYSQIQLEKNSKELTAKKAAALKQFSQARQKIEKEKARLENGQKKLDESRAEAKVKFADEQAKLNDGIKKLTDAKEKLAKAEAELKDGQDKLNQNKTDYETSIAKARKKLDDAKVKVAEMDKTKWYVWDRSDNDSCAGLKSDVSFIQEVTKAFPIIFFLVAVLISLTTMTRMVEEDRGLIGTYKSLGYSNFRISLKYIFYAVLACVFGGLLGTVVGFVVLPKVIEIIMHNIYVLPMYRLSFKLGYGLGGFGLFFLGISGATAYSCFDMLRQRPAELMRPKTPKAGSRILLERIPIIWKRLSFLNKVTCRNLFRYKKRAVMTIMGILGCTMLILFAFGIRDTVGGLMPDQFDTVTVYDAIVVTDDMSPEEMDTLANEWKKSGMVKDELKIQVSDLTLRSKSDSVDIPVMVIPDDADFNKYVHLYDSVTNKAMSLPSKGIVVTQNAAKKLKLASGDIASLQNEDNLEHDFQVAFVATNYAGNYVYMRESYYQAAFGDFTGSSFVLNLANNPEGQKWLDALTDDDRILTVSSSQGVRDSFKEVNNLLNMIVYLLVSMSAVLALAVLFTLSNINISERERELATIKVLGFQPKEVYSYVNKETYILTIIGIICGLPAGYGITYAIMANVSILDTAFKVRVSISAYLIAVAITIIFTLLVSKITNKSLRKINMVEALKSVE